VGLVLVGGALTLVSILYLRDRQRAHAWMELVYTFIYAPAVRVRLKVLLVYFQILGDFQSVLSADYPANYTGFLRVLQLMSFQWGAWTSADCWGSGGFSFYDELLAKTLLPLSVGGALVLVYGALWLRAWCRNDAAACRTLVSSAAAWIFFSCFLFFSSASTAVFQTFNVDRDFDNGDCWLKVDYSLSCREDDAAYRRFRAYAIAMMLVYPIGIPLLFGTSVWWNRVRIARAPEVVAAEVKRGDTDLATDMMATFVHDYEHVASLDLDARDNGLAMKRLRREVGRRLTVEAARRSSDTYAYVSLFEAYRPDMCWWECVECARRLALTGLLVFLGPGSMQQLAVALLVCIAFVLVYARATPFLAPSHNTFILAAQWGVLLQLFGTLMLKLDAFSRWSDAIGAGMVTVGVVFPLLPVLQSMDTRDALRRAKSVSGGRAVSLSLSLRQLAWHSDAVGPKAKLALAPVQHVVNPLVESEGGTGSRGSSTSV